MKPMVTGSLYIHIHIHRERGGGEILTRVMLLLGCFNELVFLAFP